MNVPGATYHFGRFTLQTADRRLTSEGREIYLRPKTYDTLLYLLDRHGHLVTKKDLLDVVWADVEVTENALTHCIKEIRAALEDNVQNPEFLRTIPRLGYEFVADVETSSEAANEEVVEEEFQTVHLIRTEEDTDGEANAPQTMVVVAAPSVARHPIIRRKVAVAAVVLLGLCAGAYGIWSSHKSEGPARGAVANVLSWFGWGATPLAALTPRDYVLISDFDNKTGDSVFDDTLKQGLSIQLEQSPFLNVLSDTRVNDTLKLMKRPPGAHITREVAREICLRAGSRALVAGSIAKLGNSYAIMLRAASCQTGDALASVEVEADSREHVLRRLGDAATLLRGKLGESLASIQRFDKPLEEATTSSLEALQAFTTSRRLNYGQGSSIAALPYARRAVELDPTFARGYSQLAGLYHDLGEHEAARIYAKRAYELRDHATERERFHIESEYYSDSGEADKEIEILTQWLQAYPYDPSPHLNFGWIYGDRQDFEKAIAETREAQRLMPENNYVYSNLMYYYILTGRLDEAKKTFEEAQARKLANPYLYYWAYYLAFLQQDPTRMQQVFAWSMGRPGVEDWFFAANAGLGAYYGHLRDSRKLTQQAADSASLNDRSEAAADCCRQNALFAAWVGNSGQARKFVSKGLKLAAMPEMALPLAAIGDTAEARKWIDAGNKRYPPTHGEWRQTDTVTEALVALQKGKAKEALARLEGSPTPPTPFNAQVSFVRASALLRLGQAEAAAREYAKILDHRYVVVLNPDGLDAVLIPLSYLGLGRARSLAGDGAGARQAYDQFFDIWKDADADIPVLKQAKIEYAKLP